MTPNRPRRLVRYPAGLALPLYSARTAPALDRADVQSYCVGSDLVDVGRHIQDAYDVKNSAAVLIRPDGYIGAITSRTADLAAYAARVMP